MLLVVCVCDTDDDDDLDDVRGAKRDSRVFVGAGWRAEDMKDVIHLDERLERV